MHGRCVLLGWDCLDHRVEKGSLVGFELSRKEGLKSIFLRRRGGSDVSDIAIYRTYRIQYSTETHNCGLKRHYKEEKVDHEA